MLFPDIYACSFAGDEKKCLPGQGLGKFAGTGKIQKRIPECFSQDLITPHTVIAVVGNIKRRSTRSKTVIFPKPAQTGLSYHKLTGSL